jgi:uncharacterized protein (TIGR04255 family)
LPVANFRRPPVGEVSFGLGFAPFTAFKAAHYGVFWDLIRKDYPECDDKPQVVDVANPPIGMPEWFPLPRVWYLHRNRNYLIQLQPNRIWLNWRRLNDAEEYPRFEALLPVFRDTVGQFADFVKTYNIGDFVATGAELSYVNHIPVGDPSRLYSDVGEFMADVRWAGGRKTLPNPDGIVWRTEFNMGDDRLSVDLKSGKERAGAQRPLYLLEIRASTSAVAHASGNFFEWFGRANKLIVEAFCEVTTPEAQRDYWQRID